MHLGSEQISKNVHASWLICSIIDGKLRAKQNDNKPHENCMALSLTSVPLIFIISESIQRQVRILTS